MTNNHQETEAYLEPSRTSMLEFFSKKVNPNYNLGENIRRLFDFLAKFVFTTSKTELDYYHQKVSARVASRVAKQLKNIS